MSALAIVATKLKATPAVISLVAKSHIVPGSLPQNAGQVETEQAARWILLTLVGGRDEQTLGGAGQLYEHRVRAECIASDLSTADAMGTAVLHALENVIKETIGGHAGTDISFSDIDFTQGSDDRSSEARILDFRVRWH